MAILRSTESFDTYFTSSTSGIAGVEATIKEGTRLTSSLSSKSMTFKKEEVIFSFESFMHSNYKDFKVTVNLMKKGIVISTINAVKINSSSLHKVYYLAAFGEEVDFSFIMNNLGFSVLNNIVKFMSGDNLKLMINNYKNMSKEDILGLFNLNNYVKIIIEYSKLSRCTSVRQDGTEIASVSYASMFNDLTSRYTVTPAGVAALRLNAKTVIGRTYSLGLGYSSIGSFELRNLNENLLAIQKVYATELGVSILQKRLIIFELPRISNVSTSAMYDLFLKTFTISEPSLELEQTFWGRHVENNDYISKLTYENDTFNFHTTTAVAIRSDEPVYELRAYDGVVGKVRYTGGRYLVEIDLEACSNIYEDDDIEEIRDCYEARYINYLVDNIENIDAALTTMFFAFPGNRTINRVLNAIAVSDIFSHFKTRY